MLRDVFIVEGFRTPFCKFGTDLADEPIAHLGVSPAKAIFASTGIDPSCVDEVIFGCCMQPGNTIGNIARVIGVRSGVPITSPAMTVHRNCASGFEAITYACDKAAAGKGDVFLVGGVESMSQAPFLYSREATKKFINLSRSKTLAQKVKNACKFRPSDFSPEVSLKLGLIDSLCDMGMGQTAELVARENNISRKRQDEYAELSHNKALATTDCRDREIAPYHLTNDDCIRSPSGKVITRDNGPRNDSDARKLSKLRPIFDKAGTVTAGNASQVTDGGVALLVMTREGLVRTGAKPLAKIVDYEYAGCDPKRMGLGPIHAIKKIGHASNASNVIKQMDLYEINEAFAAQVLVCKDELNIPIQKLNSLGGAIALGHPLAATGARLVLTLVKSLRRRNLTHGLASLCVGGGQGGAIWVQTM